MSIFFNYNGRLHKEGTPVLMVNNRSFRYGDGIFETMRVSQGKIVRGQLHFERLFNSLLILRFSYSEKFTPAFLINEINNLLQINNHVSEARVRLTIYRGDGNLYDVQTGLPGFVIQSFALDPNAGEWNPVGLVTDIYTDAYKSTDHFSNLKTNNFLPYAMGANYAQENKLQDVFLLNTHHRICDTTMANVFIVKEKRIVTPPLSEGCVAGTFRKYLLAKLQDLSFNISEETVTIEDLKNADEIFLTNAIQQIRWVHQCGSKEYDNEEALKICSLLTPTI